MTAGAHDRTTQGNIARQWEKCGGIRVSRGGGVLATDINMSRLRTLTAFCYVTGRRTQRGYFVFIIHVLKSFSLLKVLTNCK